jgi:hypothetical protein
LFCINAGFIVFLDAIFPGKFDARSFAYDTFVQVCLGVLVLRDEIRART